MEPLVASRRIFMSLRDGDNELSGLPKLIVPASWQERVVSLQLGRCGAFRRPLAGFAMGMEQPSDFDQCAGRLKALADPKRLRIVTNLFAGPKTVSQITEALGDDMVLVSHHLGILRASMIVVATKRGRFVEYALHPDVKGNDADNNCKQIDFGCCKLDIS